MMTSNPIKQADIKTTESLIRPFVRQTAVAEVNGTDFGLADNLISIKHRVDAAWRIVQMPRRFCQSVVTRNSVGWRSRRIGWKPWTGGCVWRDEIGCCSKNLCAKYLLTRQD